MSELQAIDVPIHALSSEKEVADFVAYLYSLPNSKAVQEAWRELEQTLARRERLKNV